jgi:hypothetical protein
MAEVEVGLAKAIASLRAELQEALEAGHGEAVQFRLGRVEVELEVVVKASAEAKGGARFWLVSAEAKGDVGRDKRHRIKLELQPVDERGKPLKVSSDEAERPE